MPSLIAEGELTQLGYKGYGLNFSRGSWALVQIRSLLSRVELSPLPEPNLDGSAETPIIIVRMNLDFYLTACFSEIGA